MKEKIGFLIVSVLLSVLMTFGVLSIAKQNNWFPTPVLNNFDEGDSVKVAEIYEQLHSPVLYSIRDAQDLQNCMVHESTVDNLYMSLTPDVLRSVVNVLLNTEGYATKELVVKEYRANDEIYNNLPRTVNDTTATSNSQEADLGATDLGNRSGKTISSSFKRRTDTIGGKPMTVVTETTERYE